MVTAIIGTMALFALLVGINMTYAAISEGLRTGSKKMTWEEYKKITPGRKVSVTYVGTTYKGVTGNLIGAQGIDYVLKLDGVPYPGVVRVTEKNYHLITLEPLN